MENSASCQWKHPQIPDYRCLHPADPRSSHSGLCFFHWDTFDKPAEETQRLLTEILSESDGETLDFQGFVFPHGMKFRGLFTFGLKKRVDFSHAKFGDRAIFVGATFGDGASFDWAAFGEGAILHEATFGDRASFDGATFGEGAILHEATFGEGAIFGGAKFDKGASFERAAFGGEARFDGAKFEDGADFEGTEFGNRPSFYAATFGARASFEGAKFGDRASFGGTTFKERARFGRAKFGDRPSFERATFGKGASFKGVAFGGGASFKGAEFSDEASFNEAAFGGGARFIRATFGEGVSFSEAAFHGGASFSGAKFKGRCAFAGRSQMPEEPEETKGHLVFPSSGEVDFRNVQIEEPRKLQFRHVDLSRVSFLETDLRGVDFLDCRWAKWKGRKKGRTILHDEEAHCRTGGPSGTLQANLRLTQSLYQQLKRNFEENRDFAAAGHFHFGEMEMRRLQVPKYRRWLSVLQWYKWASGYGESHRRAFWVFCLIVLAFTLVFSLLPNAIGQKKDQNFAGLPSVVEVSGNWEKAVRVWDSFVYSFRAASLLRVLPSAPGAEIYPAPLCGEALTMLLSVLGPLQLALFFLALRRHVRR